MRQKMLQSVLMNISLRNLPPDVETAILETSRRERISLNKAAIRLLETSLRRPSQNCDFEEFFSTWTAPEADSFDSALRGMRQVEPCDWEPVR